jgi:hypothetical protein
MMFVLGALAFMAVLITLGVGLAWLLIILMGKPAGSNPTDTTFVETLRKEEAP